MHHGKRRSKKIGSKTLAKRYCRKLEGEYAAGLVRIDSKEKWKDFRQKYEQQVLGLKSYRHQESTKSALDSFERIASPHLVRNIDVEMMDRFIALRKRESGKQGGKLSPCTVNRELRSIRAALQIAKDWRHIAEVPKIRKLKEPDEIGRVIEPAHFQEIYMAAVSRHGSRGTSPAGPRAGGRRFW